jgi:hypothetical protein
MIGSSILFAALIAMFAIILSAWILIVSFHIVTRTHRIPFHPL